MNLFLYGSLMDPDIVAAVVGWVPTTFPGRVAGWLRVTYPGVPYPLLVRMQLSPHLHSVTGLVWRDVPAEALKRMDKFEGKQYTREVVYTEDDVECQMYIEKACLTEEWDFKRFQAVNKKNMFNGGGYE